MSWVWGAMELLNPLLFAGGNAGMAAAYAARKLGLPITVVVPSSTGPSTVRRLEELGATVETYGKVGHPCPKLWLEEIAALCEAVDVCRPSVPVPECVTHAPLGFPLSSWQQGRGNGDGALELAAAPLSAHCFPGVG